MFQQLRAFFGLAEQQAEATIENIEARMQHADDLAKAHVAALDSAADLAYQHNSEARDTIKALSSEIAAQQRRIDTVNGHIDAILAKHPL